MDMVERRRFLDLVTRHARAGTGSHLADLMERQRVIPDWWAEVMEDLNGVPCAVVGGVAVGFYAPQRHTLDLDLAVRAEDGERAAALLARRGHSLLAMQRSAVRSWQTPEGNPFDLLPLATPWAAEALAQAREHRRAGLPVLRLPYLVLTKLAAGRMTDMADIARMLGLAAEDALEEVRRVAAALLSPPDREDLERLLRLGRLETEGTEFLARPAVR